MRSLNINYYLKNVKFGERLESNKNVQKFFLQLRNLIINIINLNKDYFL